jgi:NADH:ubiquinone reductase (H+-translocating)
MHNSALERAEKSRRPQVVVVGGGFGGVRVAKALARADVDVTLVDRANHHLFQPLLYQVATGTLPPGLIAPALRRVVRKERNTRTVLAEVHGIDLERKVVRATTPTERTLELPYDYLVVAGGASHAYFGHPQWSQFAPGMKTISTTHACCAATFWAPTSWPNSPPTMRSGRPT